MVFLLSTLDGKSKCLIEFLESPIFLYIKPKLKCAGAKSEFTLIASIYDFIASSFLLMSE